MYDRLRGYEVTSSFHDESGHMADALAYGVAAHTALATPRIKPMQVPCHYCGAKVGDPCLKWRRNGTRKFQVARSQPHPDRKYRARLANQAYDALNPRGDSLTLDKLRRAYDALKPR
jgi:hypothetical protein